MSLRFKMAAIASAMALTVGAALALAGPAFAVDNQSLCVNDQAKPVQVQCAYVTSTDYVATEEAPPEQLWDVNTSSSGYHQIKSTTSGGCMAFAGPSSPQIYTTACDGYTFEEWKIAYSNSVGIELQNEAYPADCLNDHYQVHELDAAPCSKGDDQLWFAAG
jgi:hypothetical protein